MSKQDGQKVIKDDEAEAEKIDSVTCFQKLPPQREISSICKERKRRQTDLIVKSIENSVENPRFSVL